MSDKHSEVKHPEEVKPSNSEKVTLSQEEEEAKHPEKVSPCLHVSESQLACWGLGRGIKATEPKRLMHVVARPVLVDDASGDSEPRVEETRVGTGYSELTFLVSSKAELTRKLSLTLTAPLLKAVALECGCSYEKSTVDSRTWLAVGQQIRNRTYAFRLHPSHNKDDATKTFVEDCMYKKYEQIPKENVETENDKKLLACRQAIEGPLGGVTHFVASIDMGGKVYREETTTLSTSATVKDASFATTIEMLKVASELRKTQKKLKKTYTKRTHVLLHPNIISSAGQDDERLKRNQTIKRSEEVVVCLRVLPIAALISDSDWAESMRIASQKFIDDELQRAPMRQPFYLKAGKSYVTADAAEGKLGTTGEKEKATPVYIETLRRRRRFPWQGKIDLLTTPGALFLLAFEIDDQRFYLCTSSRDKCEAKVLTHLDETSGCQFSLCHPCTNEPKALDDWLATGLMIQWKSGVFSSRRYLQLIPDGERASFLRRDDSSWKNGSGVAQFQLINAYNCAKKEDEHGAPKAEKLSASK